MWKEKKKREKKRKCTQKGEKRIGTLIFLLSVGDNQEICDCAIFISDTIYECVLLKKHSCMNITMVIGRKTRRQKN